MSCPGPPALGALGVGIARKCRFVPKFPLCCVVSCPMGMRSAAALLSLFASRPQAATPRCGAPQPVLPCFLRQSNRIEQGILLLLCGATRGKALAHQSSKLKMSIVPFSMSTTNYQEPLLVLRLPKSQSPPKFDCLRLSLTAPKA
jgi:hypothetical protein